jgi:outer membrane protein assembly factor BamB
MVFCQLWRESKIHAIRLRGDGKPPEPVWVSQKPGPVEPSLLYYRGLVCAMMDDGILVALDGKTGKEHYRERLKGTFNSSPVAGNGHVYVSNNAGTTFVLKAGPEFEVVATNDLGERITASPAITGGAMIYRTDSRLYCIGTAPSAWRRGAGRRRSRPRTRARRRCPRRRPRRATSRPP